MTERRDPKEIAQAICGKLQKYVSPMVDRSCMAENSVLRGWLVADIAAAIQQDREQRDKEHAEEITRVLSVALRLDNVIVRLREREKALVDALQGYLDYEGGHCCCQCDEFYPTPLCWPCTARAALALVDPSPSTAEGQS